MITEYHTKHIRITRNKTNNKYKAFMLPYYYLKTTDKSKSAKVRYARLAKRKYNFL